MGFVIRFIIEVIRAIDNFNALADVGLDLSEEFALCRFTHFVIEPKAKRPNTAKATQLLTSVVSMSTPTTKVVIIRYAAVIVSIVVSRDRRLPNEETFPVYTSSRIQDACDAASYKTVFFIKLFTSNETEKTAIRANMKELLVTVSLPIQPKIG